MPRITHGKPGLTYACPACDQTIIYERTGNGNTANHPERPYSCMMCGTALTYIIIRPKKGTKNTERQSRLPEHGHRTKISAREIEVMEPEDFGLSPIGVRGSSD